MRHCVRLLASLALAATVLAIGPATAGAAGVRLYFLEGERFRTVPRSAPAGPERLPATLRRLLKGPTDAETRRGFGTAIPAGTRLVGATLDPVARVATVRLSARFIRARPAPRTSEEFERVYGARAAQVVYTVTRATGYRTVTLEVPDRGALTLTRDDFDPTRFRYPKPPRARGPRPDDPRAVQQALAALGYLPAGAVNGGFDYRTQQAVLAFQSWEGLGRDGVVGPLTAGRLALARRPVPLERAPGRRVEVHRGRGVVLLIRDNRVARAIHTSTGTGGDSPDLGTPPGRFKIYRKEVRSWSVPYKEWLPYAAYWDAGWALHGLASVPAYPASHGCARLPLPEAPIVFRFVRIGTPVRVI